MRILILLLIFISCEESNKEEIVASVDCAESRVDFDNKEFNFNGDDYTFKKIDMLLPENYNNSLYKKYTTASVLENDDVKIELLGKSTPSLECDMETHIVWTTKNSGKTRKGYVDFNEDSIRICRDEENWTDYVEVCDEFKSI